MKKYLISNFLNDKVKEYIFIILTATILLIISFTKSYSNEKVFTVNNVIVEGNEGYQKTKKFTGLAPTTWMMNLKRPPHQII